MFVQESLIFVLFFFHLGITNICAGIMDTCFFHAGTINICAGIMHIFALFVVPLLLDTLAIE